MHLPLSERGHERKALNVGAVLAEGDIPLLPKVSLSLSHIACSPACFLTWANKLALLEVWRMHL